MPVVEDRIIRAFSRRDKGAAPAEGERSRINRLAALLARARTRAAEFRARAAEQEARADGAAQAMAALEAERDVLFSDYKNLRKRLRWHWANYPGTKAEWGRAPEGSDPFAERALSLKARLVDLLAAPEFDAEDRRVTAVVTSCVRHDLLQRTLESFFATDGGAVHKVIVVEDGEIESEALKARLSARPIEWIRTGGRVGQISAIDQAYARVETPFIFHMEDDWEFLRSGYIEKSMTILQAEPLCLQVWLKGRPPPEGHGPTDEDRFSMGVPWRPAIRDRKNVWHGFSFNPGLRRLREYRLVGSRFAGVVETALGQAGKAEAQLSELYGSVGYFAAALWEDDGAPFVKHIGKKRHVA